jgi:hypothetical protein
MLPMNRREFNPDSAANQDDPDELRIEAPGDVEPE